VLVVACFGIPTLSLRDLLEGWICRHSLLFRDLRGVFFIKAALTSSWLKRKLSNLTEPPSMSSTSIAHTSAEPHAQMDY
jgi:hypothetical protein